MELKDITKEAITIAADATLKDAVALMIEKQTNSLLVTDENGVLIGEVGVSDLLDAVVPEYLDGDAIAAKFTTVEMFKDAIERAATNQVSEFMQKEVRPVKEGATLMAVAQKAIRCNSARIPVVNDQNMPVGTVSRRGVKHIIAEQLGIEDSA